MTRGEKEVGIRLSVKDKEVATRSLQHFGKEGARALEDIEKAGRPASDSLKLVNSAAQGAQDSLKGLAGEAGMLGRLLSRGGLLGLGIAGLIGGLALLGNKVVEISRELREIEEEARRSGLGVEAFQEMTYAASQLNVSQDAVKNGFRELSIRAGEFAVSGGGAAAEAFRQIGLSQADVRAGLKDTEKLFDDIITRLGEFGRPDQLRMSGQIFGGQGGEQFISMIDAGAAAIARFRADAQELGIVMHKDMFERAREVETKFATVSRVIDTQLKSAFMELTPIIVETGNFIVWVAGVIRDIADAIAFMRGEIDKLSSRNLEARLVQLGGERVEMEGELLSLQTDDWRPVNDPFGTAGEIAAQAQSNRMTALEQGLKAIEEEEHRIMGILEGRESERSAPVTVPTRTASAGGTDELAQQAERLIERLRSASDEYARTMDQLNAMLARGLIDQGTYNRAVAEAVLKRAEAVDTEADYAHALSLVQKALGDGIITEAQYTETVEEMTRRRLEAQNDWTAGFQLGMLRIVEQNRDLAAQVGDAWASAFSKAEDALVSLVTTGKADVKDLANSIIADLLRIAIRQGITGPIAGFLGNMFGGGGAGFAPIGVPVAHSGWTVARGNPPATRAALAGLDRFHMGGLNRRERLVVAEEGEGIFTPRQMDNADALFRGMMRALESAIGRSGVQQGNRVEIHNHTGAEVQHETSTGADGIDIDRVIIGTVNSGLVRGDLDGSLRSVFGLKRGGR